MRRTERPEELALRRFLRQVWSEDVAPLLRDQQRAARAKGARAGGTIAGATGLLVDSVLGLKGRPFTRFLTVVGASFGALLPDVWSWRWLREEAGSAERAAVDEAVAGRAARLPEAEALALFGLSPRAGREELKEAWRAASLRWHPDRARDEQARREYHLRFVAYQAAYEQLGRAFDEGRLPQVEAT